MALPGDALCLSEHQPTTVVGLKVTVSSTLHEKLKLSHIKISNIIHVDINQVKRKVS